MATGHTRSKWREEAIKLREQGMSYAEIGRRLNISREWARKLASGVTIKRGKVVLSEDTMLTLRIVADYLSVHRNTLRRWVCEGKIKASRINNRGDMRFNYADVMAFLEEKRVNKMADEPIIARKPEISSGP